MAEGRLHKIVLKWMPKQKRTRGRPNKNWMEGIRKAMDERNLSEGQWKKMESRRRTTKSVLKPIYGWMVKQQILSTHKGCVNNSYTKVVVKTDYFKFLLSSGKTASSKYMNHMSCNITNLCILPESVFMCFV
jgi:hypothetical protein